MGVRILEYTVNQKFLLVKTLILSVIFSIFVASEHRQSSVIG